MALRNIFRTANPYRKTPFFAVQTRVRHEHGFGEVTLCMRGNGSLYRKRLRYKKLIVRPEKGLVR